MALMELQPGVYRIKRHVKGEFISIETLSRPEPSSDTEDNEKESSGPVTGCTELCRGAAGRTLEFACGNLFDVTDIAQVSRNVSVFVNIGSGCCGGYGTEALTRGKIIAYEEKLCSVGNGCLENDCA